MKRTWIAVLISFGAVSSADALSLTMDTDKPVYSVGESIVVTLLGDTTGAPDANTVFVDVGYDDGLVIEPAVASQTPITSFDGFETWFVLETPCGASVCAVFNQLVVDVRTPDPDIEVGTLVLTAAAPGVLVLTTGISEPVQWFTAAPPPDVTVTIVPEPRTVLLLALGLLGLARVGRDSPGASTGPRGLRSGVRSGRLRSRSA